MFDPLMSDVVTFWIFKFESGRLASIPENNAVSVSDQKITVDTWKELAGKVKRAVKKTSGADKEVKDTISSILECVETPAQDVLRRYSKKQKEEFENVAFRKFFEPVFKLESMVLTPKVYKNHGQLSTACLHLFVWLLESVKDDEKKYKMMMKLALPKNDPTLDHVLEIIGTSRSVHQTDEFLEFLSESYHPVLILAFLNNQMRRPSIKKSVN